MNLDYLDRDVREYIVNLENKVSSLEQELQEKKDALARSEQSYEEAVAEIKRLRTAIRELED